MDEDFRERYLNKYYGKYVGRVEDIQDPRELGRLKVFVPEVHGVDTVTGDFIKSGWSLPCVGGGTEAGMFFLPKPGDLVWVEFQAGDVEVPIWSHGPWTLFESAGVPYNARGRLDDNANFNRGTTEIPETQFRGEYTDAQVWKTRGGNKVTLDDTSGETRAGLEHRTGSRLLFLDDGSSQLITSGLRRDVSYKGKQETVYGPSTKDLQGATTITTDNGYSETHSGEYEFISIGGATYRYEAPVSEQAVSKHIIIATELVEEIDGSRTITIGGDESHNVGGNFSVLATENIKLTALGANTSLSTIEMTSTKRIHSSAPVSTFGIEPLTGVPLTSVGALGLALNVSQSPLVLYTGWLAFWAALDLLLVALGPAMLTGPILATAITTALGTTAVATPSKNLFTL